MTEKETPLHLQFTNVTFTVTFTKGNYVLAKAINTNDLKSCVLQ